MSRRRRRGYIWLLWRPVAAAHSGSFPVITFPDCCLLPSSMVNCYLLPPSGFSMAISCFPARAHGDSSRARRAVWALTLCGRGGARRTSPDWQLLSSAVAWVNCYLLPLRASMFLIAVSCFWQLCSRSRATHRLRSKNTVRAAFPTRQVHCQLLSAAQSPASTTQSCIRQRLAQTPHRQQHHTGSSHGSEPGRLPMLYPTSSIELPLSGASCNSLGEDVLPAPR